jgi:ATP-dependent RNA helicase DeaD
MYRLDVGAAHGVQAGNIVGAIANEAGLDGSEINGIKVRDDHTLVRLPAGMPDEILQRLAKVRVRGRPLAIALLSGDKGGGKRGGGFKHGGAPLDKKFEKKHTKEHKKKRD